MALIDDALATLQTAIIAAVSPIAGTTVSGGVGQPLITIQPGQVGIGKPVVTEITEILGQGKGYSQLTLFPIGKPRGASRFRPTWSSATDPSSGLIATISGNTITFSGAVVPGMNVVIFAGAPARAIPYTVVPGDTLASIPASVAALLVAAAIPGVGASAAGDALTITGSPTVACNVVGVGSKSREVNRIARDVQVSVYASDAPTREALLGAIEQNVGSVVSEFYQLPSGAWLRAQYTGDSWDDDSQSSYSMYIGHQIFTIEYGIMQTLPAYQIGVVETISVLNNNAPVTSYIGGL